MNAFHGNERQQLTIEKSVCTEAAATDGVGPATREEREFAFLKDFLESAAAVVASAFYSLPSTPYDFAPFVGSEKLSLRCTLDGGCCLFRWFRWMDAAFQVRLSTRAAAVAVQYRRGPAFLVFPLVTRHYGHENGPSVCLPVASFVHRHPSSRADGLSTPSCGYGPTANSPLAKLIAHSRFPPSDPLFECMSGMNSSSML